MIGYLKGEIHSLKEGNVIVLADSVGYKVHIGSLGVKQGEKVEFFIYTHVRENEISLYGFKDSTILELFEMLIQVSGIGPKSAMSLINEKGYDIVIAAIGSEDVDSLKAKGIGAKTAKKIILELKGKLNLFDGKTLNIKSTNISKEIYLDVIDALSSLGYRKVELDRALKQIEFEGEEDAESVIRKVLSILRSR